MTKARELIEALNEMFGEDLADFPRVEVVLTVEELASASIPINEGAWTPSGVKDLYVRVDAENTSTRGQRHVHVAPKKHLNAPRQQVAWNADATRHDRRNFNTGLGGKKNVQQVARTALGLGPEVVLEDYKGDMSYLTTAMELLLEDAFDKPPEPLVFISQAARRL